MNSQTNRLGVPTTGFDFDAVDWINRYFHWQNHLKYDELKPVLGFCLLWNLFEEEQCRRNANAESIRKCVDRASLQPDFSTSQYKRYLEFFRTRYFPSGEPSDESLDGFFKNGKEEDLRKVVRRAFSEPSPEVKTVVHALLLLTYRVRNNLFHGEKALYSLPLPRQAELFSEINSFLATLLGELQAAA